MNTRSALQLCLCAALLSSPAGAQGGAGESALAEELFQQGKSLMAEQRYDEACPKLSESQRLEPAGGTLINLARCHELAGALASAWARYHDALVSAKRDGVASRVDIAEKKLAALEPRLSRLNLRVHAEVPGLRLMLDGRVIERAAWGVSLPHDGGTHRVRAEAPSFVPWELEITLANERDERELTVPRLDAVPATTSPVVPTAKSPAPRRPAPSPLSRKEKPKKQTTPGWVPWVGGASLAVIGLGSYFGLRAISLRGESDDECPREQCTARGKRLNDDAITLATAADISIGVGLIGLGASLWVGLSEPNSDQGRLLLGAGGRF